MDLSPPGVVKDLTALGQFIRMAFDAQTSTSVLNHELLEI